MGNCAGKASAEGEADAKPSDSDKRKSDRTSKVKSLGNSLKNRLTMGQDPATLSTPLVHKSAPTLTGGLSESGFTAHDRKRRLLDCSDELLLAEMRHRNIKLHDQVTKELVEVKYTFGKLLGRGSSANVYQAEHKRTGRTVAIKVIQKNDEINDDESMQTELEILRSVRHRYILSCQELFESPQCIWVIMELVSGGELLDTLVARGTYTEEDASRGVRQVLLAIRYLHSQGVVHRDLKLQNLLLSHKEPNADVKVGDFGLSAKLGHDYDPGDKEGAKAYRRLSDRWGTPQYFAPEMIKKAYGPQVDVWAVGVVLFQLLSGRLPFNGENTSQLFSVIHRSEEMLKRHFRRPEWQSVSEAARDLVTKLLEPDPTKRLSPEEALQHPWIALKGTAAAGHLDSAHSLLKKQVAQARLCSLWHVLDIMNALEGAGATGGGDGALKMAPSLVAQAQASSAVARKRDAEERAGDDSAPRQVSQTDMIEELQGVFDMFDRNGDGKIGVSEIGVFMKRLGITPQEKKLRELVNKFDKNNNGELEFTEFCAFLKDAKNGIVAGALQSELNEMSNGDFIDAADIRNIMNVMADQRKQHIPEDEIEDVIAMADIDESGHCNTKQLIDAMMMSPEMRREGAERVRASSRLTKQSAGAASPAPKV